MAKIVLDTPTKEGLGFDDYADALVNIIVHSGSPFTIGILGEWGVGKTSLMKMMREKLKDEHEEEVIPIWFNAWRCERERNLAIIPLLQLLVSDIKDKKLRKSFIEILKSLQLKFSLPGGAELSVGGGSQNQLGEDIYYAELEAIETTLGDTKKKIVVFIDDLDRCAPDKILEVLESTKVFLDIKGFVYVLGLDSKIVEKAIDQKYKDMGIKGEDYLQKIVQIPFRIPDWNVSDRGVFLTDLIKKEIDPNYQKTFNEYKDIIQEVIGRTPRQVKRFINTYICEQEGFKGKKLDKTIHLILTILKFKWYDFYQNLFSERYRQNLKEMLSDENKLIEELKDEKIFIESKKIRETIEKIIKMDNDQLLKYRRAGMAIPYKIVESTIGHFIELLRDGKVSEFNDLRNSEGIEVIDLSGANLCGVDLRGADLRAVDLHEADLSETNLRGTYLRGADLSETNLRGVDLSETNLHRTYLRGADLSETNLRGVDLHGADLSETNLHGADLHETYLRGADLSRADLRGGIILVKEPNYQEAVVSAANFDNVLINDRRFLEYLKEKGAKNVPDNIADKNEVIGVLEERGISLEGIEQFFEE